MGWEIKHPLALRGRELANRPERQFKSCSLVVHRTSDRHCLVSLLVTDHQGKMVKDTRLGECWIDGCDDVGRPLPPYRLLQAALEKLLAQPGALLLPEGTDTSA